MRHRQAKLQTRQRTPRGCRRLFGEISERFEIAVVPAQDFAEVGGKVRINGLQIYDIVAFDHAETRATIGFKTDDFHESCLASTDCGLPGYGRAAQGLAQEFRRVTQ
jgi:hypothetical protein